MSLFFLKEIGASDADGSQNKAAGGDHETLLLLPLLTALNPEMVRIIFIFAHIELRYMFYVNEIV